MPTEKTSSSPATIAASFGNVTVMAEFLVAKNRLRASDGTLYCRVCGVEGARLPSLACDDCHASNRRVHGSRLVKFRRYGRDYEGDPTPEKLFRWRGIMDSMKNDQRHDRASALRLLQASKAVDVPEGYDRGDLQAIFNHRFGELAFVSPTRTTAWAEEDA